MGPFSFKLCHFAEALQKLKMMFMKICIGLMVFWPDVVILKRRDYNIIFLNETLNMDVYLIPVAMEMVSTAQHSRLNS